MFVVTGAEGKGEDRSRREGGKGALKHTVEAVAVGSGRRVVRGQTFYRLSSTWELKQSGKAAQCSTLKAGGRRQAGIDDH